MKFLGNHVLVMGSSMAGLLTARVLSDYFKQVTLVERDPIHDEPESRKGQPQTRHLHALLASGYLAIQRWFPGIKEDLVAGGAVISHAGARWRWYHFDVWKKPFESGLWGCVASRPFLEWHVRRHLLARLNVRLLAPCEVKSLVISDDRTHIQGVRLAHRGETPREETLSTDLVVDCTGRGSQTPRWLEEWGYARPEESKVKVNFAYGTRIYTRKPTDLPDADLIMIAPTPPAKAGAYMFPVEGDRWIVTAGGLLGTEPPTTEAEYMEYLRNLPVPDIYNIVRQAEPLSDIIPYKFSHSLRHHYEKLKRFPGNFLVVGDANTSLNPIYGQGMTSAALQAVELEKLLQTHGFQPDLWRSYFKRAAKVIDIAWQMAVGEDYRWAETEGPKPTGTDFINRYTAHLYRRMDEDAVIYNQFLRAMNFLDPPTSLFHPRILLRAIRRKKPTFLSRQPQSAPVTAK